MEVEDDVNKTLPEDKSEDEGEDTLRAGDSKFNYVSYIFEGHIFLNIAVMCYPVIIRDLAQQDGTSLSTAKMTSL